MTRSLLSGCALTVLVSVGGCSLIPDYSRPDLPVTDAWPKGPSYESPEQPSPAKPSLADVAWKEYFTDPTLQSLIQQALDNNRDLRVAMLNVEVARANYHITQSALLPTVTTGISESQQRTPKAVSLFVPQQATTIRTYNANLGITSFEIDVFGRVHSLEQQALEQFLATDEARNAAQISLIAEVANAALTLVADAKLLQLTEVTLDTRVKSLYLIDSSFKHGVGTQLDVAQAQQTVESAKANQAQYIRQVAQDKNALVLLVGAPIDDARLSRLGTLDQQHFVEDLPVGLPSQVLLRRPDIVQSEHSLLAANANIGAARAAFFPTISLTGQAGFSSPTLGSLFQAGSGAWSFAPQITAPIFDAGKNSATLDSAKASRDIAIAQYEKSIQSAFREVSDALAAKGTLSEQLTHLSALVEATRVSRRLSQARYDTGVDNYLTVLDSERSLYSAQQDQIAAQLARLSNLVTLYKVLGGGRL